MNPNRETQFCMSVSARPSDFGIRFHNFLYEELKLNFLYKSFGAKDLDGFKSAIQAMRALNIRGCGVSMPFKEHALKEADTLDETAAKIGAINTLVNESGKLKGYNTDALAIKSLTAQIPKQLSVHLLGSGGMAKAIACALQEAGFARITVSSRNPEHTRKIAEHFELSASDKVIPSDILINATPIGMVPNEQDPAPFADDEISRAEWIIDSVAFPRETVLVQKARHEEKRVITGAEITVLQAVEQFFLYTGVRPDEDAIQRAAAFSQT